MICGGLIKARGVQSPETCVPPLEFFAQLATRGMHMRKVSDEMLTAVNEKTGGTALAK